MQPIVLITRQAVKDMVEEVLAHPTIETAWGLYGLILEEDKTAIITGVLRPSAKDIVRRYASTRVGGERMGRAVRWLKANNKLVRKLSARPSKAHFAFLFKGHSHHGLGVDSYSWKDRQSILEVVKVDGLEIAIGPLATLETKGPDINPLARWRGTLVVNQSQRVWLRFYYLSRAMVDAGKHRPILVTPEVVDAREVPMLPPLGWQFTREDDYLEQLRHLRNYGCEVEVVFREIEGGPPFEVQFVVSKPNWRGILSIVTAWDYPKTPPRFEVLTVEDRQPTETGDYQDADHLLKGPLWNPGEDFMEAAFRLEARGEL